MAALGSPRAAGAIEPARGLAVSRRAVVRALVVSAALLALASMTMAVLRLEFDRNRVFGMSAMLDMDRENNLPTWFESAVFLLGAFLAAVIAGAERSPGPRGAPRWGLLAAALALMSFDEIVAIHERLTIPEHLLGHYGPLWRYTWIFAGSLVMAVVALALLRFVFSLPTRTRNGILFAGALFTAGAVGFEAIGGLWSLDHAQSSLAYAAIVTCEETLEIAGAIVLVDVLLAHVAAWGSWPAEVT